MYNLIINTKIILSIIILMIFLSGCPERPEIIYGNGNITIKGENIVTNTITVSPGTTVNLVGIQTALLPWFPTYKGGKLIIRDGGKLIAQGTKEMHITFITTNGGNYPFSDTGITFESSASDESIMEYCFIKEGLHVNISNSMTIQYSKFNMSASLYLELHNNSRCLINYNNFINSGIYAFDNSKPTIKYNNITNNGIGINITSFPIIEHNNITNSPFYAIGRGQPGDPFYIITFNYISGCHGETGVDLTGSQSSNITYVNPQASPVSGAGCGW